MKMHIISIFPEMFGPLAEYGVVGRSIQQGRLNLEFYNPRDYADDKHSTIDGRPYGGGPGMVMLAEPMTKVIGAAKTAAGNAKVVYLSPQGQQFNHQAAERFSGEQEIILLSGRYEGVDERVLQHHVDEEWSIGDYVLSGGELAAMVMIDAIARLLPNSLGNDESAEQDSFADGLLDCPHYARPEQFGDHKVPSVLLGGDHAKIADWRRSQSLGRTWLRRPELLETLQLGDKDLALLEEFKRNFESSK